jgi:hypothetical protein
MGIFFKKKKPTVEKGQEYNIHRTFQFGALIVLSLIIYGMYFADTSELDSERQARMTREIDEKRQLEAKSEAARIKEEMMKDPAFEKIQQFADNVTSKINPAQSSVLKVYNGYIIYVPQNIVEEKTNENSSLEIKSEDLLFKISSEKLKIDQVEDKKLEKNSDSGIKNDVETPEKSPEKPNL